MEFKESRKIKAFIEKHSQDKDWDFDVKIASTGTIYAEIGFDKDEDGACQDSFSLRISDHGENVMNCDATHKIYCSESSSFKTLFEKLDINKVYQELYAGE